MMKTLNRSGLSTMDNQKMLAVFNEAAHSHYIKHTNKTFQQLTDYLSYQKSSWADGCYGDEWETIEQATACGVEAASQYLETEEEERV